MPLRVLYIDMNSYFASVEQQLRPELRGKPIVVAAVNANSTTCIAASQEAKTIGIQSGMSVWEVRQNRRVIVVEARPEEYIRKHHEIMQAISTCIPVDDVHSIDEFSCRLGAAEAEPFAALDLARRVKQAIRSGPGDSLKCSVGIAPNVLLAKVATDLQKPDGLFMLTDADLPERLHHLQLQDLPGIGTNMLKRLNYAGVTTVEEFCRLSLPQMKFIWKGIVGERWWNWLRGNEMPEPPTKRWSVGNSQVLPPEFRTAEKAHDVLVRLIHKSAARLRKIRYWANHMELFISFTFREEGWKCTAALGLCQDTQTMVDLFEDMWLARPPGTPTQVAVTLYDLVSQSSASMPLLPADQQRLQLSHTMDQINQRFGQHTIYLAGMHGMTEESQSPIAFTQVPDLENVD